MVLTPQCHQALFPLLTKVKMEIGIMARHVSVLKGRNQIGLELGKE